MKLAPMLVQHLAGTPIEQIKSLHLRNALLEDGFSKNATVSACRVVENTEDAQVKLDINTGNKVSPAQYHCDKPWC